MRRLSDSFVRVLSVTGDLWRDSRLGARFLKRNPTYAIVAIGSLALAIGMSTAIFSVASRLLLTKLPFPDSERLVVIYNKRQLPAPIETPFLSQPLIDDVNSRAGGLESSATWVGVTVTLAGGKEPEALIGRRVASTFFDVYGTRPWRGRTIGAADIENGAAVVVLSYDLWQRRFGGDPAAVGMELMLTVQPTSVFTPFAPPGRKYEVIGVMPPRDQFPIQADIWLPLTPGSNVPLMGAPPRSARVTGFVGRLRAGVSVKGLNEQLATIGAAVARDNPATDGGWTLTAIGLQDVNARQYRLTLWLLAASINLVLLLGCVSAGSLSVARNYIRRRDVAVRATLGASRSRIARQFLGESLPVGMLAGALGIFVAQSSLKLIGQFAPATLMRSEDIHLDAWVLGYALTTSILCGLIVGVLPAIQFSQMDLRRTSKDIAPGSWFPLILRALRLRGLVIGFQIALAFLLLVGSALSLQSLKNLLSVDLGYDGTHVLAVSFRFGSPGCRTFDACNQVIGDLVDRIAKLPNVIAAGVGPRPLTPGLVAPVTADRQWNSTKPAALTAEYRIVTPGYLGALGAVKRAGRLIESSDIKGSSLVAVVNESFAKRMFGDNAIGQSFSLAPAGRTVWFEVVGVVADSRNVNMTQAPLPAFFLPFAQTNLIPNLCVLVRSTGDPARLVAAVRERTHEVDPNAAITDIQTVEQIISKQTSSQRFVATLLTLIGSLSLLLAAMGVYGLISYAVSDRTYEFGVRLALGAPTKSVFLLVVSESLSTLGWGLSIGAGAAVGLSRFLQSILFEIGPTDFRTYVLVGVVVTVFAVAAYCVPARRAVKLNPLDSLRSD